MTQVIKVAAAVALGGLLLGVFALTRRWSSLPDRSLDRRLRGVQLAVLIGAAIANLLWVPPHHYQDIEVYRHAAMRTFSGDVPYRDFDFEYPPLSLLPVLLPAAIHPPALGSINRYATIFGLQAAAAAVALGLVLIRLTSLAERPIGTVARRYTYLVVLASPLIPWRLDILVALLTALAWLAVLRGRTLTAGVWLGLGVAAKLYPIVLAPIVGAHLLARHQYRDAGRLGLGFALVILFAFVLLRVTVGDAALAFMRPHQLRGLQLESLPASVLLVLHKTGSVPVEIAFSFRADHLVSATADALLPWLPLASAALLLVTLLALLQGLRRAPLEQSALVGYQAAASAALLLVLLATSKVLSPQYMLWVLPFAPLLRAGECRIFFLVLALTVAIYPFLYGALRDGKLLALMILVVRNALIVLLAAVLLARTRDVNRTSGLGHAPG